MVFIAVLSGLCAGTVMRSSAYTTHQKITQTPDEIRHICCNAPTFVTIVTETDLTPT
jgi:hypothetical protein